MKIGILTPFDSRNFGNRLQNYALQQVLRRYAEDVITIKNKPSRLSCWERLRRQTPLAESPWVNRLLGDRRKAKILEFNCRYLQITKKSCCYDRPAGPLPEEAACDWYCAGSDQIWNPALGREGLFNYLGFAPRERTVSYAASFGVDEIPLEMQAPVRQGLQQIRFLSLREESGRRIVQQLTGREDAEVLPDPTLLLGRDDWDALAEKPKQKLPREYILAYFLGDIPEERRQKLNEAGLPVIFLMDPDSPWYDSGPGEFLYLIRHARLVCTDSFHGCVFSFLYQRPLAIFERMGEGNSMQGRVTYFASHYHLEDCVHSEKDSFFLPEEADYSRGYDILAEDRRRTSIFLDRVFSGEGTP